MNLREYKTKRDFARTREPVGRVQAPSLRAKALFVIQKHAASHLHYDFRLEMGGVLKSWAVPKGLPLKKGDRRLAVQVEDHPVEYSRFEGTIAEGNYGAGTVMVWDIGTYEVLGADPVRALEAGKLHLSLEGQKLKGEWTLVRMRSRQQRGKPQWLFLKSGNDLAPISERAENCSALTRRTLEEIAGARHRKEWQSNRPARNSEVKRASEAEPQPAARRAGPQKQSQSPALEPPAVRAAVAAVNLQRLPKARPGFVEPMKACLVEELPKGPQWVYEVKFDGVRALAIKQKDTISLVSRAANDLSAKYPPIVAALRHLPVKQAVLDGEVVAVDPQGRSAFQLLQSYATAGSKKPPLFYYAFDLLNLDGNDLTGLPLWQRKAMAQKLVGDLPPAVRFSASIQANSAQVMREMQARGLEGLIAKQKDSPYQIGQRSGAWVKFKWSNEQEFVIGGFTEPKGARPHFGAILVGYCEGGRLRFAGKVGTGFNHKLLARLHARFQKLIRPDCPFADLPENRPGSGGRGLTASQMRFCTWLEPKLVCQVRFAEWTRDQHLRQPAFLGLREDKKPAEVVRERPR